MQPSAFSSIVFVGLVLAVAGFWACAAVRVRATGTPAGKVAVLAMAVVAVWLGLDLAAAASGLMADQTLRPPGFMRVMLPTLLAVLGLTLSPWGRRLALDLPLSWLVGFQVFRLPLELVLHQLYREGVLPVQMTFVGQNYDIATGVLALPLAWLAARNLAPAWAVRAWNALGFFLLLTIVTIAVRSAPGPFRSYSNLPMNEVVLHAPFVWLPGFLVASALLGHLLLLRRLIHRPVAPHV